MSRRAHGPNDYEPDTPTKETITCVDCGEEFWYLPEDMGDLGLEVEVFETRPVKKKCWRCDGHGEIPEGGETWEDTYCVQHGYATSETRGCDNYDECPDCEGTGKVVVEDSVKLDGWYVLCEDCMTHYGQEFEAAGVEVRDGKLVARD